MSRENFEVISVLGPLGSGKTTTLNRLIEHVPLSDSYAVVVNDVGESNIDAGRIWDHPANRSEKIIPLTAGCIGCSDVTQFQEALEKVHDAGVNVLFIEPTGIAPGTEIADVVRSSGFDLSILTLTNAQTVSRDLKWQVLPSQLSVADVIGITHIPNEEDEVVVMESVLKQLPPLPENVSVKLIKPGSTDYFEILAKLRGVERQLRFGRDILPMICECEGHGHEHHHHNHGVSAKSLRMKQGVTIEHIEQLLRPFVHNDTNPLLRAKGTVGGVRFDLVGSEWNIEPAASASDPVVNVIFGGSVPQHFTEMMHDFTKPTERIKFAGDKKSIVKSVSEMLVEDRVAIVDERIAQYPAPISPLHGELIPDCEADEGYEIAFWGNRDDMPHSSKERAMDAYIRFRLAGLHELQHHPETITSIDKKGAYWRRRYGATLGYNGYYLTDYIKPDALAKIREYNPAQMLIDGLMDATELTFDEGRAEEKPEFVKSILSAALTDDHITLESVAMLEQHISRLTESNEAHTLRWKDTFQNCYLVASTNSTTF